MLASVAVVVVAAVVAAVVAKITTTTPSRCPGHTSASAASPSTFPASRGGSGQLTLAHLLPSQQRALVAMQQRETVTSGQNENKYRLRVKGLGNKFLMTHFRKDAADKRTLYR